MTTPGHQTPTKRETPSGAQEMITVTGVSDNLSLASLMSNDYVSNATPPNPSQSARLSAPS
ncbi:hypothetical protein ABIA30_003120 [Mycobacterium sp. MAA66]